MSDQVNIDFHENQDDATLLKLIRADQTLVAVLDELNGMVPIHKLEVARNVTDSGWTGVEPKLLITIIVDVPGMTWETFEDAVLARAKGYNFYAEDTGYNFSLYLNNNSHTEEGDYAILQWEE